MISVQDLVHSGYFVGDLLGVFLIILVLAVGKSGQHARRSRL